MFVTKRGRDKSHSSSNSAVSEGDENSVGRKSGREGSRKGEREGGVAVHLPRKMWGNPQSRGGKRGEDGGEDPNQLGRRQDESTNICRMAISHTLKVSSLPLKFSRSAFKILGQN